MQKSRWTNVVNEAAAEKNFRFSTQLLDDSPESLSALFLARTIEAFDWLRWNFVGGLGDLALYFHPVLHGRNVAEWNLQRKMEVN